MANISFIYIHVTIIIEITEFLNSKQQVSIPHQEYAMSTIHNNCGYDVFE